MAKIAPETFKLKDRREVQIRPVTVGDIDAFLDLRETIARETTHTLQIPGRAPERTTLEKRWGELNTHPVNLRVAAFDGNLMIGMIMFYRDEEHPWTRHSARFGMYSRRAYWGQGLGKKFLSLIEAHARANGISRIEAMVRTENQEGIRLYKSAGFQIEGTRKQAAFIDGRFQDEFFIAKNLSDVAAKIENSSTDTKPKPSVNLIPVLESANLILRPFLESDAPAIYEYTKDPEVSKYTLWNPHSSIEDTLGFIRGYALENYRRGECEPFGICLKDHPSKVIGTCGGWWKSEKSGNMEVGYALAQPYWGKGIMTEALTAVIDHLFSANPTLVRVFAHHKKENVGSGKVMEKCGMKFEGTIRSGIFSKDRYWDMDLYSILRTEWQRSRPA